MLNPFDEIRSEITTAAERIRRSNDRLASTPDEVASGQLYLFDVGASDGIEWAIIKQHVDDPLLWFVVPFDQHYQIGTWDVSVAEQSDAGEGALRCGAGIWVHADDFEKATRTGFLENGYVQQASARLAAMVQSEVVAGFHHPEVDEDSEYQDWLSHVMAVAEQLSEALAGGTASVEGIIRVSDFSAAWTSAPGIHQRPAVLAASEDGLAAGPSASGESLSGIVIAEDLPGTLVAVQESKGLRLQYHIHDDEDVAVMVNDESIEWSAIVQKVRQSRRLFLLTEKLVIRINNQEHVISSDTAS